MCRLFSLLGFLLCVTQPVCAAGAGEAWLRGIPLDKAIRIGGGPHIVIEFSDPDCRFSRRMSHYWLLRRDVTRYVFLIALKNHPEAPQKVRYILSANDRARAYQEVYDGGLDFDDAWLNRHYDDGGLMDVHREVAARLGVTGTPTYFVDGKRINGAKVREIERILGGKRIPFDVRDRQ